MGEQKRKQLGLTKEQTKTYEQCLGQCTTCMLNGDCGIQDKIKED